MKRVLGVLAIGTLWGCALRPAGEDEERCSAGEAGQAYESKVELPSLDGNPGPEDYLQVAFLTNADLEARYWQWRAAIEQIPQDSSFPNAAFSFGTMFNRNNMKAWDRTTLGIANDPMTNIPFPTKLSTQGRIALESARAAGDRFPESLPEPRPLTLGDDELLQVGSERSPELAALSQELAGRREALDLARQAYLPDFGLSASLTGNVSKAIMGMTLSQLRIEREKALTSIETWSTVDVEVLGSRRTMGGPTRAASTGVMGPKSATSGSMSPMK